jgi:hypothetical protein
MADHEIDHRPVADLDEDCICFAVTDAPCASRAGRAGGAKAVCEEELGHRPDGPQPTPF